MKKRTQAVASVAAFCLAFFLLCVPLFSFGQTIYTENTGETGWRGLVPCGRVIEKKDTTVEGQSFSGTRGPIVVGEESKGVANPCTFQDVIRLVNNVITFILFYLTIPIIAILLVWAGILFISSGVSGEHTRTKAKGIFWNAIIGLVLAFGAYIIIKLILNILGYDGSWIGF